MDTLPLIGIVAVAALGVWLYQRDQSRDIMPPLTDLGPDAWSFGPFAPEENIAMTLPVHTAKSVDENRAIFLAMIRRFEANDRYDVMYGNRPIASFADHPRQYWPINLPGYEGKTSSAAGAYQFIVSTWDEQRKRTPVPDFSPQSQDIMALGLLAYDGALPYIDRGDFETATRIASRRWASLPYSKAGQNPQTVAAAQAFLNSMIG